MTAEEKAFRKANMNAARELGIKIIAAGMTKRKEELELLFFESDLQLLLIVQEDLQFAAFKSEHAGVDQDVTHVFKSLASSAMEIIVNRLVYENVALRKRIHQLEEWQSHQGLLKEPTSA